MISHSSSMLKKDPLSERLLEVLMSALRRLEDALGEQKCRASPSSLLDKLPGPQQSTSIREVVSPRIRLARCPCPVARLFAHPHIGIITNAPTPMPSPLAYS